jgi:hypothetical protein
MMPPVVRNSKRMFHLCARAWRQVQAVKVFRTERMIEFVRTVRSVELAPGDILPGGPHGWDAHRASLPCGAGLCDASETPCGCFVSLRAGTPASKCKADRVFYPLRLGEVIPPFASVF